MISDSFKNIMTSGQGCAVIMAGSGSDEKHIEKLVESLNKYGIPHEVRICSAHKQADTLMNVIAEYNEVGGSVAYIAVAGGTDALSGTASFHTLGPVISCPPDAPNATCLTNPPGSSNAYIARAGNVGKFVAQLFAGVNSTLREKLIAENKKKVEGLVKSDEDLRSRFGNAGSASA